MRKTIVIAALAVVALGGCKANVNVDRSWVNPTGIQAQQAPASETAQQPAAPEAGLNGPQGQSLEPRQAEQIAAQQEPSEPVGQAWANAARVTKAKFQTVKDHKGKWKKEDDFHPGQNVVLLVGLPVAADGLSFRVDIVDHQGGVVDQFKFIWNGYQDERAFPIPVNDLLANGGKGKYKAKLFAPQDPNDPIETAGFKLHDSD